MSDFDRAINDADSATPLEPQQTAALVDDRAEHGICAAMMHLRGAVAELDGVAQPADFSAPGRGEIARAALALFREGAAINVDTIASALTRRRVLDKFGGMSWLATFAEPVPSLDTVRTLARAVAELAHARRIVETARLIVSDGLTGTEGPRDFVERSVERITHVAESRTAARVVLISDVVQRRRETWRRYRDEGLEPGGMPTGYHALDLLTRGMRLKTVQFAGALTGRGKSVYANAIANAIAGITYNDEIAGVTFVSGEMDEDQLHDRGVCAEARVSERDIERVMCNSADKPRETPLDAGEREAIWQAIAAAQAKLERLPIAYHAQVAGIADIRAALRDSARQFRDRAPDPRKAPRPMLLVVDYVQMMRVRGKAETRAVALAEFVYELKDIANRQNLAVLCLAQMNKSIRERVSGSGGAQAEDMKDASALAESASTVVYIHRPAYDQVKTSARRRVMWPYSEFQVTKGRGHGLGEVPMIFEGKHYRFREPRDGELDELRERIADASPKAGTENDLDEPPKAYAPGKGPRAEHQSWTGG